MAERPASPAASSAAAAGINRIIASDTDHFLVARRDSVLMNVRIPSQELPGDIDADGDVDVNDAFALAAVLLEDPIAPEHVGRSDLNGDERLDGLDVDALVPLILP